MRCLPSPYQLLLPLALLVPAFSAHAQVASFDCAKAATMPEHAICTSPVLGKKDVTVASYYQLLLRLKPATSGMAYREFDDRLRDQQRQWLHERDACQGNAACLDQAYDRRTNTLLKMFDANAGLTFGRTFD